MAKDETHWVGKIAQKAIIVKDGKVLIQRSPLHQQWDLPGGRLNTGELPEAGLLREVREEIGADITLDSLVAAYPFTFPGEPEHIFITYRATLQNPEQEFVLEEAEVAETKWISAQDFESAPIWEGVRPAIEKYFKTV